MKTFILAALISLTIPSVGCHLPPVATPLAGGRAIGLPALGVRLDLPDGVDLATGDVANDVTKASIGIVGTHVALKVPDAGAQTTLVLSTEAAPGTLDTKLTSLQAEDSTVEVLDSQAYPGGGWQILYRHWEAGHFESGLDGNRVWIDSGEVSRLLAYAKVDDAWYRCYSVDRDAVLLAAIGKVCASARPLADDAGSK